MVRIVSLHSNSVRYGCGWVLVAAALIAASGAALAEPAAVLRHGGFQVSVRTLAYDQAASFYLARGLPPALAERYARACVVVVALQSGSAGATISTRLGDWRVRHAGGAGQKVRGRSDWLAELDRANVTPVARMAFEWAQFPEDAELNTGDSIQGMLSMPVSRGRAFSLRVLWRSGGKMHEGSVDTIRCD
jgi:hypothetical protein